MLEQKIAQRRCSLLQVYHWCWNLIVVYYWADTRQHGILYIYIYMYTLFKNVAILKHILYIFPFREIYIFLFCHNLILMKIWVCNLIVVKWTSFPAKYLHNWIVYESMVFYHFSFKIIWWWTTSGQCSNLNAVIMIIIKQRHSLVNSDIHIEQFYSK